MHMEVLSANLRAANSGRNIGGTELNRTFESFNRITCKYHEDNTRSVAIERTCQKKTRDWQKEEPTVIFVGMIEECEGVCAKCK